MFASVWYVLASVTGVMVALLTKKVYGGGGVHS